MIDFIPKKYRERVESVEAEAGLIDGCKYMLYFVDDWGVGDISSLPCKSKQEVLEFVKKAENFNSSEYREYEVKEKQLFIERDIVLFSKLLCLEVEYNKRLTKDNVRKTYESLYDFWEYTEEEKQYIYNKGLELAHKNSGIDISKWKD